MKKVTYFDVEWANSKNKSICQMGIVCEDYDTEEPIFPEQDIYIDPEDNFESICSRLHGITVDKVKGKPTLPQVWKEVEPCFTNAIVVGHNVANADLDALSKALFRYNIDFPEVYYVDTLEIARFFVPSFEVENFTMRSLCEYFQIEQGEAHDAFDDACANKDLLIALKDNFQFELDEFVHKYNGESNFKFTQYVSSPAIRKAITEFYGIIQGISIDGCISLQERESIERWKIENEQYCSCIDVKKILGFIDVILEDGVITADELQRLHILMTQYWNSISSSTITLATQVLSGMLKGIIADQEITIDECDKLEKWLLDNDYLRGHYPFDKLMELLDKVLEDNILTKDEMNLLDTEIKGILDPVEKLRTQVYDVKNVTVCLTGNFIHGSKAVVADYITERGGKVVTNVTKELNILLVGGSECEAYANGTYGTKIKKAMEYNQKGSAINIIKEDDFYRNVK